MEGHLSDTLLEQYMFDRLPPSREVDRQLSTCDCCQARLEKILLVNFVHYTEDGPVYSRATRLATGKVTARHWGKDLDGRRIFTISVAKRNLFESFYQMYPERGCSPPLHREPQG
jgi:hypothetical protein